MPLAQGVGLSLPVLLNLSGEALTAETRLLRFILNVRGEMLASLKSVRCFLLIFNTASVPGRVCVSIYQNAICTQKHPYLHKHQSISLYSPPVAERLTKMHL